MIIPDPAKEVPVEETAGYNDTKHPVPEEPPPYTSHGGAGPSQPGSYPPPADRPSSAFEPLNAQRVNHLEVYSQYKAIGGNYIIDRTLPRELPGDPDASKPHASFTTVHGAIKLELAVAGEKPERERTRIVVESTHGRISATLYDVQKGNTVDLTVTDTHGSITLFIPPTFSGSLIFSRKHGSLTFLPEFARRGRTLKATDKETVVVLSPTPRPGVLDDPDSDRCTVSNVHGSITVGISGVDVVPPVAGGFFKRFGF